MIKYGDYVHCDTLVAIYKFGIYTDSEHIFLHATERREIAEFAEATRMEVAWPI